MTIHSLLTPENSIVTFIDQQPQMIFGTSQVAHDMAIQRVVEAGAVPVTWQQVLLEYQRDWARQETYNAVMDIVKQHSGTYGSGIEYACTMIHKKDPTMAYV